MAVHVRFESWCISLPSSAKQQREMTKFFVFWRKRSCGEGKIQIRFPQGVLPAVAVIIAETSQ